MKKVLLGLALLSSMSLQAGVVEIIGDSTTLRPISTFDATKYDIGIETTLSFEDEFKLKWSSLVISASGASHDLLLPANAGKVLGGALDYHNIDLDGLKGAADANTFCAVNAAVFTAANVTCAVVAGAPDLFSVSAPITVDYAIKGSIELDVVAMRDVHPVAADGLLALKLGSQELTTSMVALVDAQDMKVGLAGGDIASLGYAGIEPSKNIDLSFQVPFKGTQFKNQRGEIVKMAVVASSL